MTQKQKTLTLIGLSICYLGTACLPYILKKYVVVESNALIFIRFAFIQLFLCAAILYFIIKVEKRDWSSIGFKSFVGERDVKWGLIGFGIGGMSFALTGPLLESWGMTSTAEGITRMGLYPIWFRIGVAIVAGTTEEVLFRGYPIERLTEWCGNVWLASAIPILVFTLLHIPSWSLGGSIQIGLATIIWTLIYIKTRSIWTMVIMHIVNDLFAFVLLPYFFN